MITKDDDKGDEQKAQRSKNNSSESRTSQEEFKTQEESLESRIKIQGSRSQESRLKIQESREDLIKISMKKFFQKLSSTWIFLKTFLPKSFYSLVINYQIIVIDYQ